MIICKGSKYLASNEKKDHQSITPRQVQASDFWSTP